MPTEIHYQAVIDRLLQRLARLEYELAVAQEALAVATADDGNGGDDQ